MTDLSHWNLVPRLTRSQAARLACGLEPQMLNVHLSSEQNARVAVVEAALFESSENAWKRAIHLFAGRASYDSSDFPWINAEDFFDPQEVDDFLPSDQLWSLVDVHLTDSDPDTVKAANIPEEWKRTNRVDECYRRDYLAACALTSSSSPLVASRCSSSGVITGLLSQNRFGATWLASAATLTPRSWASSPVPCRLE